MYEYSNINDGLIEANASNALSVPHISEWRLESTIVN